MFYEIIIAMLIGCLFGLLTGITPGFHINLVAAILFSISSFLLRYTDVIIIAVFIVSMSITHTFADFIAAIYFGAPADDTALSVLPGHRMLLKGMGHEAVKLTVIGSFFGLIILLILSPLLVLLVPVIFNNLKKYIGWLLLAVVIFMILRDTSFNKKFWNFFVFISSGILGLIVLNFSGLREPLLPMFSGLFGVSMLMVSLSQKVTLPMQRITEHIKVKKNDMAKALSSGVFSGSLVSIFPALGPAQAAVLGMQLIRKTGTASLLILLGSINTVSMILSLVTLYTIGKARNGSIVVVQKLINTLDSGAFILFLIIALVAGCIAAFLTLYLSKIFSLIINKIKYSYVSMLVIIFITLLVFYVSGFAGVVVLVVSTFIGLVPILTGVNRSNLMGCLLLPVILFYLV